jgi:hypothetical protein
MLQEHEHLGPVDRVLQHTGHRVIVFGRHDEDRICLSDTALEVDDRGGRPLLVILVEDGNAFELEDIERCPFRNQPGGGPEGGPIV